MHMHPTVGRLLVQIGREFKLPAVRVPREPAGPMRRSGGGVGLGAALNFWSDLLRYRAQRAGMQVNDNVFGIQWSGHMTTERVLRLIPTCRTG